MKKQYFRDTYGNTATITAKGFNDYHLICRDYLGRIWKRTSHVSAKSAKAALSRTGEGWHTTKGFVA